MVVIGAIEFLHCWGISGCIGKSHEETRVNQADGCFHREMDTYGVRAKADVLGVPVADLRAGYIDLKEAQSRQTSLKGKSAQMLEETSFEGAGADLRFGSAQDPSVRLQGGVGRFEERVLCQSTDGTHSFHRSQTVLGHRSKISLGSKSVDLRAGYIESKEQEIRQTSLEGKSARMLEETSFQGHGTDVQFRRAHNAAARNQSGVGRFEERVLCQSTDGTHSFHRSQIVLGHRSKISLGSKSVDLRAGYIESKEQEIRQTSLEGKSARMLEETSFQGHGTDVQFRRAHNAAARNQSGVGRFEERVLCQSTDGRHSFHRSQTVLGHRSKISLGSKSVDLRAGYIESKEQEIRQTSLEGKSARMLEETSFQGHGTDVQFRRAHNAAARNQSGVGRFEERVLCQSTDGTHSFHRSQTVLGHRSKISLGSKSVDLRAGYIESKEQEIRQTSLEGKSARMLEETSFQGHGTDVQFRRAHNAAARNQSGVGRFEERVLCQSTDGTHSFHRSQIVLGHRSKISPGMMSVDLRAGKMERIEARSSLSSVGGATLQSSELTSFSGVAADLRVGRPLLPDLELFVGCGNLESTTLSSMKSSFRSVQERQHDSFHGQVFRIRGLDLDTGTLHRRASRQEFSLSGGYVKHEKSHVQKICGLEICLQRDTLENSDAFGFMYRQRSTSYVKGSGAENVQLPFLQYSRNGGATLDSSGDIKFSQDASITDISFSDVTKHSIRQTANFVHDRNIHNLDAGAKEIWDGAMTCVKSAGVDELTHGFMTGMQNRGYPTKTISMALNMVVKPLWRAYQAGGEHGLQRELKHGLKDWLSHAGQQALDNPAEFVSNCVNTAAPLLGSDLNVQWTDNYKGLRMWGRGFGVGTQVDSGKNGFIEDTGLHGSYRLRSTLNTVGAGLSINRLKSRERTDELL